MNVNHIANQVIPIDPQRANRAAIKIENEDYLYDLEEYVPRENK
jgi:hypothetical protein